MRVLIAIMLLAVPLSGCIGGVGLLESDLFDYIEVERGDPTPVAFDECSELLDTLNLRAEQRALVSLHQDYEGAFHHWRGGGPVVFEAAEEAAVSDDSADGASSPSSAPSSSPEVTGTNNQEQDVDEADIIKTDGTWTYTVHGNLLFILHSSGVGNLTLHSTVELPGGWASQLLLEDRGTADDSDDRLVVVMRGVPSPEPQSSKPREGGDSDAAVAEDIAYYDGGSHTRIQVYDLADRKDPQLLDDHSIEGENVGVRLVDGIAYVVIHQWEQHLGLQTYAYPDDELLKDEGLTWEEYRGLSQNEQKRIMLKSVERAIEKNDEILEGLTLEHHLPEQFHLDDDGNLSKQGVNDLTCSRILTTPDDMGRSVSTILSLDVGGDLGHQTKSILGGYPIVYGATDALVLASSSQEHWWFWAQPDLEEATNLHWFDLDGLDVDHRASGRVVGIVQDQFGIDVHNDQLRVTTTTGTWGRWWLEDPTPMMNHLFVFDEVAGQLVPTGSVTGFAEEERIWSARFTDDRAYIVTFRQIDPLWIIDLTDPSNPTILGELEIPGVSTYIHPLPGEDQLLTIGIGPRSDGAQEACEDADCVEPTEPQEQGLDWNRIQVSLFDISDPTNPTRSDVYDVSLPKGDGDADEEYYSWGYSSAVHEHKAFTYWDKLGILSVPVSYHHYERSCSTEGNTRTCVETNEFHTGLDLITVDRENGELSQYGAVDQDHMMRQDEADDGYYWGSEVQRSYFLGYPDQFPDQPVSVYALSNIGMSAHDLEALDDQDSVRFFDARPYEKSSEQALLDSVGVEPILG